MTEITEAGKNENPADKTKTTATTAKAPAKAKTPTPPPSPTPPKTEVKEKKVRVEVICEGILGPLGLKKGDITDNEQYVRLLEKKGQQKVVEVK